jgi:glycine/sarcosine N-methyltransferase
MDARNFYDSLGEDYDRMVSWEARLGREEAFFQRLFDEHGVQSVLDAGCGTGMHAVSFARLGLRSAGADLSPAMIEQAREHAREAGVAVELAVAPFGGIAGGFPAPFDAVTCLGNSLPHLLDDDALAAALADFAAALRPSGILVIQNRNYDRVLRERQRFMPLTAREGTDGETLFLRITEFAGGSGAREEDIEFTIVTLRKRGGQWSQAVQTTALRALRRTTLERALVAAGFASIEVYGNYALAPYDAPNTGDLVVIARKGA